MKGLSRQPHTEACRARFQAAMKEEAKVKRAEEQQEEFARLVRNRTKRMEEREENKRRKLGTEAEEGERAQGDGAAPRQS